MIIRECHTRRDLETPVDTIIYFYNHKTSIDSSGMVLATGKPSLFLTNISLSTQFKPDWDTYSSGFVDRCVE